MSLESAWLRQFTHEHVIFYRNLLRKYSLDKVANVHLLSKNIFKLMHGNPEKITYRAIDGLNTRITGDDLVDYLKAIWLPEPIAFMIALHVYTPPVKNFKQIYLLCYVDTIEAILRLPCPEQKVFAWLSLFYYTYDARASKYTLEMAIDVMCTNMERWWLLEGSQAMTNISENRLENTRTPEGMIMAFWCPVAYERTILYLDCSYFKDIVILLFTKIKKATNLHATATWNVILNNMMREKYLKEDAVKSLRDITE